VAALPTGTVTLLFTDIEGSTRLWEQYPEAMATALHHHDSLLRATIESAGGYVFKTVGDGFCAVFASARAAVEAAGAAQQALRAQPWPDDAGLRVRMAMHTGECEERDGDYFGPVVNRTARLEATVHGGQVVVSQATAALVRDRLPSRMRLVDLGSHRLKDLDREEEIFQLVMEGVPAEFPPLRSEGGHNPTNLTEPLSSFVGRDAEVAEITKLLRDNRLVTLAGSGGVGKTRLATEVGRALLSDTEDGVWLVELATVDDQALVASEVLADLGIGGKPGQDDLDALVRVLAAQHRLIIMDNCEQVIDGCATVADTLLRSCKGITLLTTSREPLRIGGEAIYRVPSLSFPPEHVNDATDLAGSGAVALFVERASAQSPEFEINDDEAPLVAAICRRLDGMPLALELATARLGSMSLAQLHSRLEHRFGVLTAGSRVALPRQQTLRAMVDWSYDLLSGDEQALFRRVSVFVDGFDLEAAEGVCRLTDIPEGDIADLLASLVDKSLVVAEPRRGDIRYRLLETLRQYGSEHLAETGLGDDGTNEAARVAAAHAAYYLSFAEQGAPHLAGTAARSWLRRLDSEELNLRAAIAHTLGTPAGAGRVLDHFWSLRRYWQDVRQPAQTLVLLDRSLDQIAPDTGAARRGQALYCKAVLLHQVDLRLALEAISAALALAREAGDRALEADALSRYCRCLADNGRNQEAVEAGGHAVDLARQIGDPVLLGTVLFGHATALHQGGDAAADSFYLEALAVVEQSGDQVTAWKLHNNYATSLLGQGHLGEARRHLEVALELSGSTMSNRSANMFNNLGWILLQEGESRRAASYQADLLRSSRLNGNAWMVPYAVLGLACCATQLDSSDRAAVLLGGADALLSASSDQWEPLEESLRLRDMAVLRERLGEDFDRHYAAGRAMAHGEIVKLALSSS
jgi:predicted ATPase/class 3 adenylate cyclase